MLLSLELKSEALKQLSCSLTEPIEENLLLMEVALGVAESKDLLRPCS